MSRADIFAVAFVLGAAANPFPQDNAEMSTQQTTGTTQQQAHPYAGMWVTVDGSIRHNLLPNGRYDEARGNRESAYQGRYEVRGDDVFLLGRHRLHRRRQICRRRAVSRGHDPPPQVVMNGGPGDFGIKQGLRPSRIGPSARMKPSPFIGISRPSVTRDACALTSWERRDDQPDRYHERRCHGRGAAGHARGKEGRVRRSARLGRPGCRWAVRDGPVRR